MQYRFFKQALVAAIILAGGWTQPVWAVTNYWNFNSDTKADSVGDATLQTSVFMAGVEVFSNEGYGGGTEVNRVGETPAGRALSYLELGVAFSDITFVFENLDFTGINNVEMSFAFRSTEVFTPIDAELIRFEYSTNGGLDYTTAGSRLIAGTDYLPWTRVAFSFGTDLNNESNVAIRVTTRAAFAGTSSTQYDNIQIVPEPSVAGLAGMALMLALFGYGARSRRRARA